jgi:ribonucleoside-diphosphate reductase alpha chain
MIFATPVLFNSAIKNESYSSCFLTSVDDDIDSIFDNIKNCAIISKHCGGISVDINRVRASDSIIKSSGFKTDNSIVKLSKLYNDVSTYINQGGKRNGSIALYIEPWHADIYSFLDLKTNIGDENSKARDIFQALWVPDNFMKAVESDSDYYLMCPSECHFDDKHYYGDKFEEKYNEYVSEGKYRKKIKAKDLWKKIINTQIETGLPYILYKDTANKYRMNDLLIRCSNLCAEIMLPCDKNNYSTCNLACINVDSLYFSSDKKLYLGLLKNAVRETVKSISFLIDTNTYHVKETEYYNMVHKPMAIGIAGLADLFQRMRIPYDSDKAKEIATEIVREIYYSAVECSLKSCYGKKLEESEKYILHSIKYTEGAQPAGAVLGIVDERTMKLQEEIKEHGLTNLAFVGLMPTSSTSLILGVSESFEPKTSNIFTRRNLSGTHIEINKYLIQH